MFRVEAQDKILYLPNPKFGDGFENRSQVLVKRMVDGTVYTYVRKVNHTREYSFEFELTNEKLREVVDFLTTYLQYEVQIVADQYSIVGYINVDPKTMTSARRAYGDTTKRELFTFFMSVIASQGVDTLTEVPSGGDTYFESGYVESGYTE